MDRLQINKERDYKVVKPNELVQKARYELSCSELKALHFIISKIKPEDRSFTEYTISVNEYCDVLGIDRTSGNNYKHIKETLKSLRDTSFWLTLEDGTETSVGWLDKVWIRRGSGKIKVRLDEDLQKYLVDIKNKNFTQFELFYTLPMQSSYSIRIYELMKSYAFTRSHTFDLEELKDKLGCTNYDRFPDFRRKVLEISTKEINLYTDIKISWEPIKNGRKVEKIKFKISKKNNLEMSRSIAISSQQLDGQMSIYDYL